jgi:hypothetical protein
MPRHAETRWALRRAIAALVAIVCLAGMSGRRAAAQSTAAGAWDVSAYRIKAYVALDGHVSLTPTLLREVTAGIEEGCDAAVGAPWNLSIEPAAAPLARTIRRGLDLLKMEDLPQGDLAIDPRTAQAPFDKVMLVRVSSVADGYQASAREFDVVTRQFGTPAFHATAQREGVARAALFALLDAFCPLGVIEEVANKEVKLRLRGGALAPREPGLGVPQPGAVFRPIIRVNLPDGSAKEIRVMDWTWLYARQHDGTLLTCTIYSGLRSPLSARRRGRTQQLALFVRPPGGETRLTLVSGQQADLPMYGYDVYTYSPESPETNLLGTTDSTGAIDVPSSDDALRLLLVRNGGQFVARLPIVPGAEPAARAVVINDQQRLAVEGYIAGLQENVLETVVQREVYLFRIRKRMDEGNLDEATKLLDGLRALTTRERFLTDLTEYEKRVFTNDARAKARIDKLFTDTRALVDKYLDPRPVDRIVADLAAAQKK